MCTRKEHASRRKADETSPCVKVTQIYPINVAILQNKNTKINHFIILYTYNTYFIKQRLHHFIILCFKTDLCNSEA